MNPKMLEMISKMKAMLTEMESMMGAEEGGEPKQPAEMPGYMKDAIAPGEKSPGMGGM